MNWNIFYHKYDPLLHEEKKKEREFKVNIGLEYQFTNTSIMIHLQQFTGIYYML